MGCTSLSNLNTTYLNNNAKVKALETTLNQSVADFQDLILDIQQLHINLENNRLQYLSVKEKCENKTCTGVEELKQILATKDHIIQAVASTLTKVSETKDLNILDEAFKILFGEISPLTPPTDHSSSKSDSSDNSNKAESSANKQTSEGDLSVTEDVSFTEESASETEGTPTGRTSPIIQTKKKKTGAKSDVREKKKCPNEWATPPSKALRLVFSSGGAGPRGRGRLRQARLDLQTVKQTAVVDLTCSPDLQPHAVQPLIKKESMEDDTILPSPTSGPTNFSFKTSRASPSKFKKPKSLSLKSRCEQHQDENRDTSNNATDAAMDESINILNQFANRLRDVKKENSVQKGSPIKEKHTPIKKENISPIKKEIESVNMEVPDDDVTNASIFIQNIEQTEEEHRNMEGSPTKRPLAENINATNTPPKRDAESSISLIRPEPKVAAVEAVKRKLPELVEPVYKEPVVRKKAEKRNLQGWSCEECKNFYGVLYKDDAVMLARKLQECSRHRGRRDPARPATPPNFWNPRWTVPEDTDELNRMNGAL